MLPNLYRSASMLQTQRIIMKSADQSVVSTSPCLCDGLQCAQLSALMLTTIVVNIGAGQGDALSNIPATLMATSWCGQWIIVKSADQSVVSTSPCLRDGFQRPTRLARPKAVIDDPSTSPSLPRHMYYGTVHYCSTPKRGIQP